MHTEHVAAARAIQRRTGKTFHLATRLLPPRVRRPTYVLYGFFRMADEVVDDPGDDSPADQRAQLEALRAQALGQAPATDPVLTAFQEVRARYDVPDAEVEAFVDAMCTDVDTDRYETYTDLERYMRGSAAAVGAMMTAIMDPADREAALPHAIALGEAFQLTNFLRDVREDVLDRDRIYLPRETLRDHGTSAEAVASLTYTPEFADAMADLLDRTESLYREGVAGIHYLPRDCQFPVTLAAVLYAEHHRLLRAREFDVLSDRPSLSTTRTVRCLVRARWHWFRSGDPEATFGHASAVPTIEADRPPEGAEYGPAGPDAGGAPSR